jgi:23S rRNA (guanosine2251-2'-O)-methyltransferase
MRPAQHQRRRPGGRPERPGTGDWLYGRRPVLEALRAGRRAIHELWLADSSVRHGADDDLVEMHRLAQAAGAICKTVARDEWKVLPEGANHQGVALRVGGYPYVGFETILQAVERDPSALVLILDHIEDPQNVGSLLRTADAAGVTGVVLPEDRAAGVTPAAVRASAGASEHLPVAHVVNLVRAIDALKKQNCWITGLDAGKDARPYQDIDYRGRCALVVGNEGEGLGRLVREHCDFIARLPMRGHVASLNAGVAGALAMYEVVRQRGS